jgi:hypothetical protein
LDELSIGLFDACSMPKRGRSCADKASNCPDPTALRHAAASTRRQWS